MGVFVNVEDYFMSLKEKENVRFIFENENTMDENFVYIPDTDDRNISNLEIYIRSKKMGGRSGGTIKHDLSIKLKGKGYNGDGQEVGIKRHGVDKIYDGVDKDDMKKVKNKHKDYVISFIEDNYDDLSEYWDTTPDVADNKKREEIADRIRKREYNKLHNIEDDDNE